uniref:Uncharacterized protein n=1 Tax=Arundo donax TaxID=35708 RepID=A0A0A9BM09_ARUDO
MSTGDVDRLHSAI